MLNCFAPTRPHTIHKLGGRVVRQEWVPYTIKFDNEIVDMILALEDHYQIVWATMWNYAANAEIVPALGIDEYPVLYCDHEDGSHEAKRRGTDVWQINNLWYPKTPLIPQYVAGRPFAWVDDDHTFSDERWLRQQPDVPQNFLLVRPDANIGLTWAHVAELITWAQTEAWNKPVPAWDKMGGRVPYSLSEYSTDSEPIDYDALFHEQIVAMGLLDDEGMA